MKRLICVVFCLVLVLTLSACNTTTNVDATTVSSLKYIGDRNLKSEFESYYSSKDLLSNVSNIDLSQDMGSISGLELVTEENEENSSSIDVYYRNDEKIYAVYNGYGENLWKYYTTGVDGTKIIVSFWDENDSRNVKVESNDESVEVPYTITFNGVDNTYSLGAKEVTIAIYPENSSYALTAIDGSYYMSSATYWDEEKELHKFVASYDADTKSVDYHTDNVVISHEVPSVVVGQEYILAAGLRSTDLKGVAILLGKHTVYKNEEEKFFVHADTTLVFESADAANVALERLKLISVNAYAFTVTQDSANKYYLIDIGACNYALSDTFEDGETELINYAINDYDDYIYKMVSLDESMSITGISNSSIYYY